MIALQCDERSFMTRRGRQKDTPNASIKASNSEISSKDKVRCEEARERILTAAQSLFAVHGFSATTTKAIAQRAEVPTGLIFYYFPTKKALLESVISERSILSRLRDVLETQAIADPHSALLALGSRYLTLLKEHRELAAIQLREFRSHPAIAIQMHELREEHIQLITSYIYKVLQDGQYELLQNVQVRARIFLYNILEIALIEDLPEPLRFVEDMIDILLCGITRQT
jgi:AcrR family transcriptional regulator